LLRLAGTINFKTARARAGEALRCDRRDRRKVFRDEEFIEHLERVSQTEDDLGDEPE
jgi:hypothetical protein